MQGNVPYMTDYVGAGMAYVHATNPAPPERAAAAIGAQPFLTPPQMPAPVPDELLLPSETEARGQLSTVQLPVGSASPTHSAWCSVSNLLAVAFTPEPGSSTAQILVIEPSNPEDCTALELPVSGPGDYITSLEWSWPGQRRALLSATASGRLVVWTQPSQQGQDDSVFPRCIDDWHGQLLLDLGSSSTSSTRTGANGSSDQPQLKQEPGGRPSSFSSGAAAGPVPYIKPEPGMDVDGTSTAAGGAPVSDPQQPVKPLLAAVCWLRQPSGGRSWSTSSLAIRRLDPWGEGGSAGAAGAPGGPSSTTENFESLFCEEAVVPGAVPHWARPHQLTAAVLTASGSLVILWSMVSKLPSTLSWYRSKTIRIPPPLEVADGGDAAIAAAAAAAAAADAPEWRIAGGSMCAVHDGSLAVSVVYGRRRDAVYMYTLRGNPTLSGQLVAQNGAAAVAAVAVGGGPVAAGREALLPTVTLMARLAMPLGVSVRQCRLHLSGDGCKKAYVLAQLPTPATQPPYMQQHTWPGAPSQPHLPQHQPQPQQQRRHHLLMVMCFTEAPEDALSTVVAVAVGGPKAGGATWRAERHSPHLDPHDRCGGVALPAVALPAVALPAVALPAVALPAVAFAVGGGGSCLGLSVEGSKLVVPCGSMAYSLDAETLTVLSSQDLAQAYAVEGTRPNLSYGTLHGNGHAAAAAVLSPRALPPVLSSTACLSSNSCCLCSIARLGPRASSTADGADGSATDDDSKWYGVEPGGGGGGAGGGGGGAVMLSICTVPDVVPPPLGAAAVACGPGAPSLESIEDTIACNMDTMRLAWGLLHRLSLWDVAERLRCAWLAGRRDHVTRSLDQLDGLMYGAEEPAGRMALSSGVSRAKLEVLRRIQHPQAALLAADLMAGARVLQYSQTLAALYSQQSEALAHTETRTVAAHMVWFVLEAHTLMLAGLKLWAEEAEKRATQQGQGQAEEGCGDGGGSDWADLLPLIRLYPDYQLHKHVQLVLLGTGTPVGGKQGTDGRNTGLGLHPAIQELLGGPEVGHRVRVVVGASAHLHKATLKLLSGHLQALQQQQNGTAGPGGPALVPGAPVAPVTAAEVELAAKSGDLPWTLMHRTLQGIFSGPFHMHYSRCKGLITAASLAQCFRQEEFVRLLPYISLPRETILERYRALGLQQQLMDPRHAPNAAARKLWMSFRAPAPPPELHSHILTQHVSSRQRQRWRRQRGAALALGSSAPLWSHAQGALVDCLTGVPLPPGTSWSLEGAPAVGAVTAQMGPGVGAAASRRNLPPLLAAVQRAWVCCAPPVELGSQWKRARLGLEQDMEY